MSRVGELLEELRELPDAQKIALAIRLARSVTDGDLSFSLTRLSAEALQRSMEIERDLFVERHAR